LSNSGSHPSRFGRYVIAARIGHGAMGDVYAGVDDVGRAVAVRIGISGDLRVHQQARMTGQVAHPNVVSVLDLGEVDGRPFVGMERLDGAPLDPAAMRLHPLDARLELMMHICDGLHAAHERGVVHGHLKPGHVFMTRDGGVKLLDFGAGDGRRDPYAAPEQVRGAGGSTRADIFSAAAVCYAIATGRAPFTSHADVLSEQPPAIAPTTAPDALGRTLLKALEKDPTRRHQSVNHLRAEIEQVRRSQRGDRDRVIKAALDRFQDIVALVAERRALGRRLGLPEVDRDCDARLARLAAMFPEFANGDGSGQHLIDPARASNALAGLHQAHNELLAEVSVLQAASGGRR
jgi:serine/threonine-protein kinase